MEPFTQPRRFGFLAPQLGAVVAVVAGMSVAGFQLVRRGYIASGVSLLATVIVFGWILIHVWKTRINRSALVWDGSYLRIYPLVGDPVTVVPAAVALIISADYLGVRVESEGKQSDITVARAFFGRREWEERKRALRTLGFRRILEQGAAR